jgi:hypothetical protein
LLISNRPNTIIKISKCMSKYDKAQGEALRYLEDELLRLFGFPEELLEIWRNSHVKSILRDRQTGVKFETDCKSGDVSTFFGNTLVLISVLLSCYDIDDISWLLVMILSYFLILIPLLNITLLLE